MKPGLDEIKIRKDVTSIFPYKKISDRSLNLLVKYFY